MKKITDSEVIYYVNAGFTPQRIADKFSMDESSVYMRIVRMIGRGILDKARVDYNAYRNRKQTHLSQEKISDEDIIKGIKNGKTMSDIASECGIRLHTLYFRIKKLRDLGLVDHTVLIHNARRKIGEINSLKTPGHNMLLRSIPIEQIVRMYAEGMGVMAISKRTGIGKTPIKNRLRHFGILDSSRQYQRDLNSRARRRSLRKPYEFSDDTKEKRYYLENGICQWCKDVTKPIPRWEDGSYHHIKVIDHGQLGIEKLTSLDNCMLLHKKCNEDNFYALHGFELSNIINRNRRSYEESIQKESRSYGNKC